MVLPAAFPNLLANGSTGIAVGMATSIPPHNAGRTLRRGAASDRQSELGEDRRAAEIRQGPDFPTGGIIVDDAADDRAKPTRPGAASSACARAGTRKSTGRGTYQIVVTEIPYQVQKAELIERIAELLEQKKLPLLDDIRDESAEDVRIVLEPKSRTVEAEL